jgi:two-component system sensor kinase
VAERTAEILETSKRLEDANKSLANVNRELETFAYSVSHDLRTPLRAVDGFSRILLEEYAPKLDTEGQRIVGVVREGTKKMAQMIDDILAFSRAGKKEVASAAIDMEELVRAALKDLQPLLAGRYVKLEIKPLPASHGDAPMIQRVWTNLLDNAIKFTRHQPEGTIEVGAQVGKGEIVYYVKDNGVGFDMQYVGKLFGVFQRLHGQNEFPGTGIGLAIVKRIVARHGGHVWAGGKVNQGATIYFALPNGSQP